jgi:hypothetical protein
MMTFANSVYPRPNFEDQRAPDIEGWGVYFYGTNGTLQVNRMGWALRPSVPQTRIRAQAGAAPGAAAGGGRAGGAPGGGRAGGAPGGGRGGAGQAAPLNVYINPRGAVEEDYPLHAHTRDFLDKLKVRNRQTNAPMEVGYNSALPALLALEAMKQNKVLGWDPATKQIKVL